MNYSYQPRQNDTVLAKKPACKQCGRCCRIQVCLLGFIVLATDKTPCPALVKKDGKYWCGLITDTRRHAFPDLRPSKLQVDKLRRHFLLVNNFGEGCDLAEWKLTETK